ncbi:hypothetical protein J7M02_04145 [Candidatus Aerophobetes bacterium]|nr:hypothetical protein [Candidatus Aerophobetes bacterium]
MEVLSNIPIKFSFEEISKYLRINDKMQANQRELIKELIDLSANLINPKAVYKIAFVENKTDITLDIGKVQFKSKVLRKNLDKLERVFPYIITVGKKLEDKASSMKDLLKQYYLERIADLALDHIQRYLETHLKRKYKLGQISTMSPGSLEDWPITQQKELFSIFGDSQKIIGVSLTNSFLMIPKKSVSGIYFPTEIKFHSCQLCPRKGCIERKAPYDPKLAEKY